MTTAERLRKILTRHRYRSFDYSNDFKIKATDALLDKLVAELLEVVEDQEKKVHAAYAPDVAASFDKVNQSDFVIGLVRKVRKCNACGCSKWEPYVPLGRFGADGLVCAGCGNAIENSTMMEEP